MAAGAALVAVKPAVGNDQRPRAADGPAVGPGGAVSSRTGRRIVGRVGGRDTGALRSVQTVLRFIEEELCARGGERPRVVNPDRPALAHDAVG